MPDPTVADIFNECRRDIADRCPWIAPWGWENAGRGPDTILITKRWYPPPLSVAALHAALARSAGEKVWIEFWGVEEGEQEEADHA